MNIDGNIFDRVDLGVKGFESIFVLLLHTLSL